MKMWHGTMDVCDYLVHLGGIPACVGHTILIFSQEKFGDVRIVAQSTTRILLNKI